MVFSRIAGVTTRTQPAEPTVGTGYVYSWCIIFRSRTGHFVGQEWGVVLNHPTQIAMLNPANRNECVPLLAVEKNDVAKLYVFTAHLDTVLTSAIRNSSPQVVYNHVRARAGRPFANTAEIDDWFLRCIPSYRQPHPLNTAIYINPSVLRPLYDAAPAPDFNVDLVFVHGLGGDMDDTWGGGAHRWIIHQLLPLLLLHVVGASFRLLTIGHRFQVRNHDQHVTVDNFVRRIQSLKVDAHLGRQPIIWFAHSLGGLLTTALLQQDDDLRAVTKGAIFFGTPHRGSASAGTLNALNGAGLQPDASPALRLLSQRQENIRQFEEWKTSFLQSGIPCLNFVETLATGPEFPILGQVGAVVVVDVESAEFQLTPMPPANPILTARRPNAEQVAVHKYVSHQVAKDHVNICKLGPADDPLVQLMGQHCFVWLCQAGAAGAAPGRGVVGRPPWSGTYDGLKQHSMTQVHQILGWLQCVRHRRENQVQIREFHAPAVTTFTSVASIFPAFAVLMRVLTLTSYASLIALMSTLAAVNGVTATIAFMANPVVTVGAAAIVGAAVVLNAKQAASLALTNASILRGMVCIDVHLQDAYQTLLTRPLDENNNRQMLQLGDEATNILLAFCLTLRDAQNETEVLQMNRADLLQRQTFAIAFAQQMYRQQTENLSREQLSDLCTRVALEVNESLELAN